MTLPSFTELESMHLQVQKNWYLRDSAEVFGGLVAWSDLLEDSYWNYFRPSSGSNWEEGIEVLQERGRTPAISMTPGVKADALALLAYRPVGDEAWMVATDVARPSAPLEFRPVGDEREMDLMVEIFASAYSGGADEPYGALPPSYGQCLRRTLGRRDIWHLIAWSGNEPVGIGSVAIRDGLAALYNGGVVPRHRGRGFGTAIAQYRAHAALAVGARAVFLQTERGSRVETMLERVGFRTEHLTRLYVQEG